MAADTEPLEILLHLPLLAEDKVLICFAPFVLFRVFFTVVLCDYCLSVKSCIWLSLACCRLVSYFSFVLRVRV
jgi:hypothetical protein